jgi:hypothetical protein
VTADELPQYAPKDYLISGARIA